MPDYLGTCPSSHPGCCFARTSDCMYKRAWISLAWLRCALTPIFLCLDWQRASYIDFFSVWLSSVWLWFSYLIHYCYFLFLLAVTSCAKTWGSTIRVCCPACVFQNVLSTKYMRLSPAWAQRSPDSLLPLPFRCPQGYVSSEFMWSFEWCWKKWKVIFLNAPHRVQSHYRLCQIQLVTEFAAQERGKKSQLEKAVDRVWRGCVEKVDGNQKQGFLLVKVSFFMFM